MGWKRFTVPSIDVDSKILSSEERCMPFPRNKGEINEDQVIFGETR